MACGSVEAVMGALTDAVDAFQSLDLDSLTARETMALARRVEVVRRRLDAGTDRLAGHLQDTGKFGVTGTATPRTPSPSSAGCRRPRATPAARPPAGSPVCRRWPPPTSGARSRRRRCGAICRTVSNPRVAPLIDDVIDKLLAEQAATESHRAFVAFLRDLEQAADPDGAGADAERTHERRSTQFNHNGADDSYELRTNCGSLQGAVLAEVLEAFEAAEWEADRAEAVARFGPDATPDQLRRTPTQRRTDAVVAIFRLAGSTPPGARAPEPLVNVIIDAETLEDELARIAGDQPGSSGRPGDGPRIDDVARRRICRTLAGRPLHPSDVVACLLIDTSAGW